ncbi:MAG: 4Fe-4S dicluster domain-containing protein [Candidatus Thorarchaeota archaeon]|nr:4Fe-4S dicluster domain-containing protein [Candidatus Thorarchaeota archaeon]
MSEILTIDINRCTGCRNCELACSVVHSQSFNPKRSRIQILKDEVRNMLLPMVCLQCEDPLCQEACPNGAIIENEYGILYVDSALCIGCMNCVTACVYGGIAIDPVTKKAVKCDLCSGDPACAKACEYGAITLVKREPSGLQQRRRGVTPAFRTLRIQIEEGQE